MSEVNRLDSDKFPTKTTFNYLKKCIVFGEEIEFEFRGEEYFISGNADSSYIAGEEEGHFESICKTKEELAEKGTVQGHLLKDIIDEITILQIY